MSLHICPIEPPSDDNREEPNCKQCGDEGTIGGKTCDNCAGTGFVEVSDPEPDMSDLFE